MAELDKSKLLYLPNARNPEQRAQMEQLIRDGICPFCPEHLAATQREPIVKTGTHWVVKPNDYPYKGTRLHLLFIPFRHVISFEELSPGEKLELFELMNWAAAEYKFEGGSVLMRFGNPEYNGGTIYHLHPHLIVGDPEITKTEPVVTRVG